LCAQIGQCQQRFKVPHSKITLLSTCPTERRKLTREHSMAGKR